jgi:hypothetical protein
VREQVVPRRTRPTAAQRWVTIRGLAVLAMSSSGRKIAALLKTQ